MGQPVLYASCTACHPLQDIVYAATVCLYNISTGGHEYSTIPIIHPICTVRTAVYCSPSKLQCCWHGPLLLLLLLLSLLLLLNRIRRQAGVTYVHHAPASKCNSAKTQPSILKLPTRQTCHVTGAKALGAKQAMCAVYTILEVLKCIQPQGIEEIPHRPLISHSLCVEAS
jgi:hypothetical protein